jgi:hypothetical protein
MEPLESWEMNMIKREIEGSKTEEGLQSLEQRAEESGARVWANDGDVNTWSTADRIQELNSAFNQRTNSEPDSKIKARLNEIRTKFFNVTPENVNNFYQKIGDAKPGDDFSRLYLDAKKFSASLWAQAAMTGNTSEVLQLVANLKQAIESETNPIRQAGLKDVLNECNPSISIKEQNAFYGRIQAATTEEELQSLEMEAQRYAFYVYLGDASASSYLANKGQLDRKLGRKIASMGESPLKAKLQKLHDILTEEKISLPKPDDRASALVSAPPPPPPPKPTPEPVVTPPTPVRAPVSIKLESTAEINEFAQKIERATTSSDFSRLFTEAKELSASLWAQAAVTGDDSKVLQLIANLEQAIESETDPIRKNGLERVLAGFVENVTGKERDALFEGILSLNANNTEELSSLEIEAKRVGLHQRYCSKHVFTNNIGGRTNLIYWGNNLQKKIASMGDSPENSGMKAKLQEFYDILINGEEISLPQPDDRASAFVSPLPTSAPAPAATTATPQTTKPAMFQPASPYRSYPQVSPFSPAPMPAPAAPPPTPPPGPKQQAATALTEGMRILPKSEKSKK